MRRTLREIGAIQSSAGKITLRMSLGVHSGTFLFFLVGSSHRDLIITGPSTSETVVMEGTAVAGEIMVSKVTAAALPQKVLGRPPPFTLGGAKGYSAGFLPLGQKTYYGFLAPRPKDLLLRLDNGPPKRGP